MMHLDNHQFDCGCQGEEVNMLFILKHVPKRNPSGNIFYLISGHEYIVGRRGGAILIRNDQSISKKHALIKVEQGSVTLTDLKSNNGTYLQNKKVDPETTVILNDKDQIKFGVYDSLYLLEKVEIVATGSGLNQEQKGDLQKKLKSIGCELVNSWDSKCTHLVMVEVMLTIKILHAIVDNKPVVTLEYWTRLLENVKNNLPLPDYDDFKPPLNESLLSEEPVIGHPRRQDLFRNKIFVFPNDILENKMADIIKKTGGSCISWQKKPLDFSQVTTSPNTYIFVSSEEHKDIPHSLKVTHEKLMNVGQRPIPVREVARAIYLCSCEKDCNPLFNRLGEVFNVKKETEVEDAGMVLAAESHDYQELNQIPPKQEVTIPGTFEGDLDSCVPSTSKKPAEIKGQEVALDQLINVPRHTESFPSAKKIKLDTEQEGPLQCILSNIGRSERQHLSAGSAILSVRQGSSRRNDVEIENNPFKRMRSQTDKVTQQSISLNNQPQKRGSGSAVEAPAPKKTSKDLFVNPYVSFKRLKKERPSVFENNPFVIENIIRTNENSVKMPRPSVEEVSISQAPSFLNTAGITTLSETKWLSKTTCEPTVKAEDEFKTMFERFKNSVVIQVVKVAPRRLDLSEVGDSVICTHGGKNFKKFKKVTPKRPQTNIITACMMKTHGSS